LVSLAMRKTTSRYVVDIDTEHTTKKTCRTKNNLQVRCGHRQKKPCRYVVDIDKDIDVTKLTPNVRIALKSDTYVLHKLLPSKVRGMLFCKFDVIMM
jgi:ATP-dependent 26S proteasome regulatory subunit